VRKNFPMLRRSFLFGVGLVALVLGVVGIVVPLLPTTPFLLLAAAAFARSSESFHHWLLNHSRLGSPIRDWEERGVIRLGPKILATAMILPSAVLVLVRSSYSMEAKALIVVFFAGLLLFLWSRASS
jgi:uncharacterized protein